MHVPVVEPVVRRLDRRLRRRRRRYSSDRRGSHDRRGCRGRRLEAGVLAADRRWAGSREGVRSSLLHFVRIFCARAHFEDNDDYEDDGDDGAGDDADHQDGSGRRRFRCDVKSSAAVRTSFSGCWRFGLGLFVVDVVLGVVVFVDDLRGDRAGRKTRKRLQRGVRVPNDFVFVFVLKVLDCCFIIIIS